MSLKCCVLANSPTITNTQELFDAFDCSALKSDQNGTVCLIGSVACVLQVASVPECRSSEVLPHAYQLMVEMTETDEAVSSHRGSRLKLAELMTAFLSDLCSRTEAVGILWRNFGLHDLQTWTSWCQLAIPTALWITVDVVQRNSGDGVRTQGLDFFGQPELFLATPPGSSEDRLELLRAFADYLITSDDVLTGGDQVEFLASDTSAPDTSSGLVIVEVLQIAADRGECELHIGDWGTFN